MDEYQHLRESSDDHNREEYSRALQCINAYRREWFRNMYFREFKTSFASMVLRSHDAGKVTDNEKRLGIPMLFGEKLRYGSVFSRRISEPESN